MKLLTKQFLMLSLCGFIFTACKDSKSTDTKTSIDSVVNVVTTEKVDYPYTIKNPDNWELGTQQNTLAALTALKAWENKNMDLTMNYFADSIDVAFNGFEKKISNDSLRAMITPDSLITNRVKMQDWESVISKDKKEEYVTLWYREYTDNSKGKSDSIDIIDDIKMKDGKITGLQQYQRKLH